MKSQFLIELVLNSLPEQQGAQSKLEITPVHVRPGPIRADGSGEAAH
jgi:hypothetical protein